MSAAEMRHDDPNIDTMSKEDLVKTLRATLKEFSETKEEFEEFKSKFALAFLQSALLRKFDY